MPLINYEYYIKITVVDTKKNQKRKNVFSNPLVKIDLFIIFYSFKKPWLFTFNILTLLIHHVILKVNYRLKIFYIRKIGAE